MRKGDFKPIDKVRISFIKYKEYTAALPYETTAAPVGSPWSPGYAGKWRTTARIGGNFYTNEVTIVNPDDNFSFTSPVSGNLDYLLTYFYERTADTPANILSVSDIYNQALPAALKKGSIQGKVTDTDGQVVADAEISLGSAKVNPTFAIRRLFFCSLLKNQSFFSKGLHHKPGLEVCVFQEAAARAVAISTEQEAIPAFFPDVCNAPSLTPSHR